MADQDDDVLGDVFSSDRDRGADTAAPVADPKADVPKDENPQAADDGEDKSKQYRDPENGRFVPLTELKSEREKRQEAQRLREESDRRAMEYERRALDAERRALAVQQQYAQPQQQQFAPQVPDVFTDPDGFREYVEGNARMAAVNERLNMSQMMAEQVHGEKLVAEALEAATKAGVNQQFISQRHPYEALVKWYKKQSAMAEVGDDLGAYEKRIREKVLAELKAGNGGQPQQRFPGTLADATASGGQGAILTDEAMMADVFATDRRSRKRG